MTAQLDGWDTEKRRQGVVGEACGELCHVTNRACRYRRQCQKKIILKVCLLDNAPTVGMRLLAPELGSRKKGVHLRVGQLIFKLALLKSSAFHILLLVAQDEVPSRYPAKPSSPPP